MSKFKIAVVTWVIVWLVLGIAVVREDLRQQSQQTYVLDRD